MVTVKGSTSAKRSLVKTVHGISVSVDRVTLPEKDAVTVTSVGSSSSRTLSGSYSISTVPIASLSAIVTVAGVTVLMPCVPCTVSVSPPSDTLSPITVSVKVAVPLDSFAGMVTLKGVTAVKSSPAVAVPSATVALTTVASGRVTLPGKDAVTVICVLPLSSSTSSGSTPRTMALSSNRTSEGPTAVRMP